MCAGLPILLGTIARALKDGDSSVEGCFGKAEEV
jgi:hypothetical protein